MYGDIDGLRARYPERILVLVSDTGKTGARDDERLSRALADACEEIDAYVRQRYTLPLGSPRELLKRLEADIAVYRLSVDAGKLTEERRKRYEDAIALLKRIADGDVSLGIEGPEPATARPLRTSAQESRFDRTSMRGAFI